MKGKLFVGKIEKGFDNGAAQYLLSAAAPKCPKSGGLKMYPS